MRVFARATVPLLLAATIAASIACGDDAERVSVSLAMDWYPNANHAGLFIAQEKGYFEEEGLDVTIYTPDDPATVLLTVGSGQDDFGLSYQTEVLLAIEQQVPVISVAALVQHPLNSIMALKTTGIERPKDLKDKKDRMTNHSK